MSAPAVNLLDEGLTKADRALAVMAFVADDVTRQTLVRLAAEQKWQDPLIQTGGFAAARKELAENASPALLVVDLSESKDVLSDVNELADLCDPGTRVIALGTANDVRLYRSLIDAGVSDYMVKPVAAADLARAVNHAISGGKPDAVQGKQGRIIAVTGVRGGVGASTVALNLAWLISHEQNQRVVLVDLDLQFGTVALSLDVDSGTGFRDVLQNPSRIDPLFLERAAISIDDKLAILAMEDALANGGRWSAEAFAPLLTELAKTFDVIVLDLPRALASQHPELISAASSSVVVTDLSLPAMRDALRIKALVRDAAPQSRVKIAVNHHRPAGKGDMPAAEFERSIEDKIFCTIPFDPKAAAQAAGAGRPMAAVAKKGKGTEVLRKMSQSLVATKAKKSGFSLGRLFKR